MKEEIWLHIPTFTTACVVGDFGVFVFNNRHEESYWGLFRAEPLKNHGWIYITDL